MTVKGSDIYCFKTVRNHDPEADTNPGSIVLYEYRNEVLTGPETLVTGLDKGLLSGRFLRRHVFTSSMPATSAFSNSTHSGVKLRRVLLPGFVTFLNRSYERTSQLYVPAAAPQIRRLDGADLSLSQPS